MAGGWPHPDSGLRYVALLAGAGAGLVGALLVPHQELALRILALAALALFAHSHASAVHHDSPRLLLFGVLPLLVGGALLMLSSISDIEILRTTEALPILGIPLAWFGVGGFAAAQWFDRRETFGMSGLGFAAAALGFLGYLLDRWLGFSDGWVDATAGWAGGEALWQWFVVPWRLAYALTLVWFAGTGVWLAGVHVREHATRPDAAGPAQQP